MGLVDLRSATTAMPPSVTLAEIESAIVASWGSDTSSLWSEESPARGQCDVTALVVREILGGSILCCNVVHDGRRIERHAWNRLASGIEIDLTRRQFDEIDGIGFDEPVEQEPYELGNLRERAAVFSQRVHDHLGQ